MITHLHVKSRDDSLNGIAVIGQTIFVENWLWRPSCFSEIAENQYQPSLCHLISALKVWWWYIHNFSFNWSDVVKILSQHKIGCGGHLVFQKLLKIHTSQVCATLYPYKTFGEDIFITFPLIDRTSSIFWVSKIGCGGHLVFQKMLKINTSYWHHRHAKKIVCWYLNNFFFKWSDKVSCGRLTHHAAREQEQKQHVPPPGDIIKLHVYI